MMPRWRTTRTLPADSPSCAPTSSDEASSQKVITSTERVLGQAVQAIDHLGRGPGGARSSVHCTVAPDDEVLLTRVAAPLQGVHRVDLESETSLAPGESQRLEDVLFDPEAG